MQLFSTVSCSSKFTLPYQRKALYTIALNKQRLNIFNSTEQREMFYLKNLSILGKELRGEEWRGERGVY